MLSWMPSLKKRSLLTLLDVTDAEMLDLVELSIALKKRRRDGIRGNLLEKKQIALIFEKSSTRTRNAASVAVRDEGGYAEYLTRNDIHIGTKESVSDTARVLGRMFDGILFRGFSQKTVQGLSDFSGVPVWNGLTDDYHPTQILADLMTLKESFGRLKGLKLAYVGDGRNNVANTLMIGCAKAGIHYSNSTPAELLPDENLVGRIREIAAANGSTIEITTDPKQGVKGANAVYTDVWVSMGEEAQKDARLKMLRPYQVNAGLMEATGNLGKELIFLHCLPAFHNSDTIVSKDTGAQEVTDEVFESGYSKVFDEAENRMHTIKALYVSALADQ